MPAPRETSMTAQASAACRASLRKYWRIGSSDERRCSYIANLSTPEFPPGTPRFHPDFDLDGCALQLRAELVHGLLHLGGVLPGELDLRAAARTGPREPRPNLVERNRKGPAAARAGKAGFDPAHANRQSARSKREAAASRCIPTTPPGSRKSTARRWSSRARGACPRYRPRGRGGRRDRTRAAGVSLFQTP